MPKGKVPEVIDLEADAGIIKVEPTPEEKAQGKTTVEAWNPNKEVVARNATKGFTGASVLAVMAGRKEWYPLMAGLALCVAYYMAFKHFLKDEKYKPYNGLMLAPDNELLRDVPISPLYNFIAGRWMAEGKMSDENMNILVAAGVSDMADITSSNNTAHVGNGGAVALGYLSKQQNWF